MQERQPGGAGAVHCGEQSLPTKNHLYQQAFDDAERLRALHLIHRFAVHPDMAMTLAALAFSGGSRP